MTYTSSGSLTLTPGLPWPTHLTHRDPEQLGVDLPRSVLKHRIRFYRAFIHQFLSRFDATDGKPIFEFLSICWVATADLIRERKIVRQQPQLAQRGRLVPSNVLVVEMITPYIYDTCEWNREMFSSRRHSRKSKSLG